MDGEEICLCRSRMAFHGFYLVLNKGGRDGSWDKTHWSHWGHFHQIHGIFQDSFCQGFFYPGSPFFIIFPWLYIDIYDYISHIPTCGWSN